MITRNFTSFPVLITNRLTLRQLTIDDQQDIHALRSDPTINKYLGRTPSRTIDDAITFINTVTDNIAKNNSAYWAITQTETNAFLGTIGLFEFSENTDSCEIGFELMTPFQGQGIMKEAAEKVIDYAFHSLKVQKIIAVTHKDNMSSVKLLEKLNFQQTDELFKENPDCVIFNMIN
jgi:[ribosomal protein S5]-alanine N-acetyltransferase